MSSNSRYQIAVIETIGGAPIAPGTLIVTIDNAALGTISGPTLVAGLANAAGNLTVTDTTHNLTVTVAISVASTHPLTSGDSVALVGSIAQTITRPLPAPVATPPTYTSNSTVAIATTTTTGATFGTTTGLVDFKSVEQDTTQSPVITKTITTDAFLTLVANGTSLDVVTPGSFAKDSNGNTFTTKLGVGNGTLDVLPESNGATFANNAASTYAEADADGTTLARTTNPDGTYAETDTFADGTSQKIALNPDLSGSIATVRGSIFSIAVSAPTVATASTGSVIKYALSQPGPTPTSTPIVQTLVVPNWYPTTTLAGDSSTTATAQAFPKACNVPAAIGTSATALAETFNRLDTVLGTYERRSTTTYLAPLFGVACVQINDKLDDYYDYSRQLGGVVQLAATPIQTTVTTETIGLKLANVTGAPTLAAERRSTISTATDARAISGLHSFAVATASFERVMQRAYAERRREVRATLSQALSLKQGNR